jgi:HAE1 family hydrophobic/amphiphilic exporter-1
MNLRISSWAIRNPIPVVVAFTLATFAGVIAYFSLPIKQFPNIAFPAVMVVVVQDGAAPTEMENQVTRLVENAIAGIPNIEAIASDVSLGVSTTMVQFEIGTSLEKVKDDVQSKVDQIRIELPAGIEPPRIEALDFTGMPMVSYAVSAPSMSPTDLSWFIDDTLTRALQAVPGVGQVNRIGGVDREINVTLDPVRMAALGLTAPQVNNALRNSFRNYGGGRAEIGGAESTVRVLSETLTVAELRNMTIPIGGSYVRLTDVADVGDGSGEERGFARLDGRPVVGFNIIKVDDASEVQVDDATVKVLADLVAANPGVTITKIVSIVDDTRANYEATVHVLLEGMVLAALVVFFFLKDWRSTAIAAAAMPLSLIPTFFVIGALGFSLNVVTLLALTLVIGILVDDAIVEIENIQKRTQSGASPFRAAMEGADAIGLAVVATTAAIAVVFLPVSFIQGISGQFFKEFGITVAVAVVFSLLVARFVTPLMAAYFLKPATHVHDVRQLPRLYEKSLTWCVDHPWGASLIGALSFFGAIVVAANVPAGFIPTEDPGYIDFSLDGPPGTTKASMERASAQLTDILMKHEDVEHVFVVVGSTGANGDLSTGRATAVLHHKRDMSTDEVRQVVRTQLSQIPDIRVTTSTAGPGGGSTDVDVILSSENIEALEKAQIDLMQEMRTSIPAVANPRLSPAPPGPELIVRPKDAEAARLNVSPDVIAAAARIATTGDIDANSAKFSEGKRRLPIRVRLPENTRTDIRALSDLRIPTLDGGMTTLGAVADITFEPGPGKIQRYARERRASVQADFAPGVAAGTATQAINASKTITSLPPDVKRASIGQEQAMGELFGGILMAMGAGVAFIYSVLVLLFRSIFKPIVIMSALPLSFSGAFIALFVTQLDITMPVLIGLLMLLGLAAKNSILLVEFAIEAERDGRTAREALFAACRERARPIVMTTVAMSAGMLPTALGIGEGASFRQPMAVAVIGGLISSTILSLVLVPAVYKIVDDFERWLNPRAARLVTPRTEEDEELMRSGEV